MKISIEGNYLMLGKSGMNRIIAVLVALLMGASWQIIAHQHEIRKLNIELEKEKGRYSDLKLEYQRLELQNSKDSAVGHVETLAREKEEAEAAKKIVKKPDALSVNPVAPPVSSASVSVNNELKTEATKIEVKKENVRAEPLKKQEPKPVAKQEVNKEDIKPVQNQNQKQEIKKAHEPAKTVHQPDKLEELIKNLR